MAKKSAKTNVMVILAVTVIVAIVGGVIYFKNRTTGPVEAKPRDKITLQLKWVPQAQFAGYYVALKKGYYTDENIDVTMKEGGVGINPVDVLVAGDSDIAVAWTGNVLPAIAKGEDIVNIGQGFQSSGMVLVAKKSSGILAPADIAGKKIGVWTGGNETEPFAFIAQQGLDRDKDVKIVSEAFDMNQLLNNEIDLASAMTYNELELVYEAGLKPADLTIFNLQDLGAGMLQDALFVKRDFLNKNQDLLVRFLRATMKGWDYAVTHQTEAVDLIGMDFTANDVTAKEHQIKSMAAIAKLVVADKGTTQGLFYIDTTKLQKTLEIAQKYVKEVKEGQPIELKNIYTNDIWTKAKEGVTFSNYSSF